MNWFKTAQNIKSAETENVHPENFKWLRSLPQPIIEQLREIMKSPHSGERAEKIGNLFKKNKDSISYNRFVPDYVTAQQIVGLEFYKVFPEYVEGAQGDEFRHLKRWKRQSNYGGAEWDGWYAAPVGQSRDSDTVEKSNWEVQLNRIPESDTVMPVAENHWAVGWVEWLAIHESDREALQEAEKIGEELESYPILDEEHHSQMEWNEMTEMGYILDSNGEWVEEVSEWWNGTLERISLQEVEGVTASGTFNIHYAFSKREGVRLKEVEPVDVEVTRPRGRAVIVSNGQVINQGLAKMVEDELMGASDDACDHPAFRKMCEELHSKYGM